MKRTLLLTTSVMVLMLTIMSGCSSKEMSVSEYTEDAMDTAGTIADLMTELSVLSFEAVDDLTVIDSTGWTARMDVTLADLVQRLDEANEIAPPSELEEVDVHLQEAVRYFRSTPEKLMDALKTSDIDTLVDIAEDMKLGNEQIGLFIELVDGL